MIHPAMTKAQVLYTVGVKCVNPVQIHTIPFTIFICLQVLEKQL